MTIDTTVLIALIAAIPAIIAAVASALALRATYINGRKVDHLIRRDEDDRP